MAWQKFKERFRSMSGSSRDGSVLSSTGSEGRSKEDYDGDALENWVFVDESEVLMKFQGSEEGSGKETLLMLRRKFITLSAGQYQSVIPALGGKLLSEETSCDQYYDFMNYSLTLNCYSLRVKNGQTWTLNYPLHSQASVQEKEGGISLNTVFAVTEDEDEIVTLIQDLSQYPQEEVGEEWKSLPVLPGWLQTGRLMPTFKLARRNCRFEVNDCHIDLEEMGSPGCLIVDIGTKAASWLAVDEALWKIDQLAVKLDLVPLANSDWNAFAEAVSLTVFKTFKSDNAQVVDAIG